MRSEDQLLANKSTRRSRGLLFDNNWSSDRIWMFEFISKKFADIKILHEGYTADYFLNRMKTNALLPILFIQSNLFKKKKKQVSTFFIRLLHRVHFGEILSGYFLYSRFDWSIFVTQLVARHMKEIISLKNSETVQILSSLYCVYQGCFLIKYDIYAYS
jgi:hypothetical protein